MNSITRLILSRLAAGNVRRTPPVRAGLKAAAADRPVAEKLEGVGSEPTAPPVESIHVPSVAAKPPPRVSGG
jgi:hypothetical protein